MLWRVFGPTEWKFFVWDGGDLMELRFLFNLFRFFIIKLENIVHFLCLRQEWKYVRFVTDSSAKAAQHLSLLHILGLKKQQGHT